MIATNKSLFLLRNHGQYPNLCIKTLYTVFSQHNIDPYCALITDISQNTIHNNTYQKLIHLIKDHFIDYINHKKLLIIENINHFDITNVIKNYGLLGYNFYFPIECQNIYLHNYSKNIIDFLQSNHYDATNVKSIYGIDINNNFISHPPHENIVYTKQAIINSIRSTTNNYTSQEYMPYVYTTSNKYNIIDQNFNLVWIEEQSNNPLQNSYIFVYKKNNKVFNITNNIHGLVEDITETKMVLNWNIDQVYKKYTYELNENNIFINIEHE